MKIYRKLLCVCLYFSNCQLRRESNPQPSDFKTQRRRCRLIHVELICPQASRIKTTTKKEKSLESQTATNLTLSCTTSTKTDTQQQVCVCVCRSLVHVCTITISVFRSGSSSSSQMLSLISSDDSSLCSLLLAQCKCLSCLCFSNALDRPPPGNHDITGDDRVGAAAAHRCPCCRTAGKRKRHRPPRVRRWGC